MVLDALIAFCALLFELLIALILMVVDLLVSLVIWLLSLFGRKIERVAFREQYQARRAEGKSLAASGLPRAQTPKNPWPKWSLAVVIGVAALIFLASLGIDKVRYRTIEVAATDGHVLPFAKFIAETGDRSIEVQTDTFGKFKILQKTERLSIRDERYKKQTWEGSEISDRLTVERSLLGKSLDFLLDKTGVGD